LIPPLPGLHRKFSERGQVDIDNDLLERLAELAWQGMQKQGIVGPKPTALEMKQRLGDLFKFSQAGKVSIFTPGTRKQQFSDVVRKFPSAPGRRGRIVKFDSPPANPSGNSPPSFADVGPDELQAREQRDETDEKPKSAIAPVQRDMPMANNAVEPTPYTPERPGLDIDDPAQLRVFHELAKHARDLVADL
jgi:hypothetical protein